MKRVCLEVYWSSGCPKLLLYRVDVDRTAALQQVEASVCKRDRHNGRVVDTSDALVASSYLEYLSRPPLETSRPRGEQGGPTNLLGQEDGVDHVDHAVRALDIRLDELRFVESNSVTVADRNGRAV